MDWSAGEKPEEYAQLEATYRDLPDQPLLTLARDAAELTPVAQAALRNELARRSLALAPSPHTASPEAREGADPDEPIDWTSYAPLAAEDCTFSFATERQTADAHTFLAESGVLGYIVPSWMREARNQGPCLVVRPADARNAALILAEPIPTHIASEPDLEPEDFSFPACPICGALEPLLESADPTNQWHCEECQHRWAEEISGSESAID
jgi:hypothetical protein